MTNTAGMLGRFIKGFGVDEDTMALDLIDSVGPLPGTFLTTSHTRKWWRHEQYVPKSTHHLPYEQWVDSGSKGALDHARERMEEILATHRPTPLSRNRNGQSRASCRRRVNTTGVPAWCPMKSGGCTKKISTRPATRMREEGDSVDLSILERLKQALLDYDEEAAAGLAAEWIAGGGNPIEAMAALTEAIQIVGDGFGCGDLFLPDLVGAATAMEAAVGPLQEAVRTSGMKRESFGIVVLGTVAGDIHTIGKSMVGALLSAAGFEVYDIGIDVSTEKFLQAVEDKGPTFWPCRPC